MLMVKVDNSKVNGGSIHNDVNGVVNPVKVSKQLPVKSCTAILGCLGTVQGKNAAKCCLTNVEVHKIMI